MSSEMSIHEAVERAEIAPLLAAAAHLTGDLSILRDEFRARTTDITDATGGLGLDDQNEARTVAASAIVTWMAAGSPPPAATDEASLRRLIEFVTTTTELDDYLPLFEQELGLDGDDLRAPDWRVGELAGPSARLRAVVIGAGMSGIVAGHRLLQAGADLTIVEKNADVGGTWFENSYPGCRVDVPNHFYSYSFAQKHDWEQHYSTRSVLLDYFRSCAADLGLRPHIRFDTEVVSAVFAEETASWTVTTRSADGVTSTIEADVVVSAVGQLNRPKLPDIVGLATFAGPAFHSAAWDHDVDLDGKRVAVIGTGASALQLIPPVAERAARTTIFQRTPPWILPTFDYRDDVGADQRFLLEHVPGYLHWYRFWLFWRFTEGLLPYVTVDPEWGDPARSVSASNDQMRELLTGYLRDELADRPDLLDKVLPDYPPLSKRFVRDDGSWLRTLERDDVELLTDEIAEITPAGIRTRDGVEHPADVLIFSTGFHASNFLMPMDIVGREGIHLHDRWNGEARAYYGTLVPGFPNLFLLYGPNTNIVVNGSIIFFSECAVQHILRCLELVLEGGHAALDCRPDVHDAYNRTIDAANLQRAWGAADVNTWYKNAAGRVTQNWPFSLLEYWKGTATADPEDFEFLDAGHRRLGSSGG